MDFRKIFNIYIVFSATAMLKALLGTVGFYTLVENAFLTGDRVDVG